LCGDGWRYDVETGVYHVLKPGGLFSMIDVAASSDLLQNAKEARLGAAM